MVDERNTADDVVLTVCTTCRRADVDPDAPRPGSVMLAALTEAGMPEGVTLRGVECLSACTRGCAMALTGGPARWTYIYGDMDPDVHVPEILDGIAAYAQTSDGLVPWRARPVAFRKQTVARVPPLPQLTDKTPSEA